MPRTDLLRSALWISTASAVWTLFASTAAVTIGLADASLALVAFGAVGLFDFAADLVLVSHFRALHFDRSAEHLERIALRVVTGGLAAVGLAAGVISIVQLIHHKEAHNSLESVALAAASTIGFTALALRKRHLAVRLPSRALHADGRLSAVGAALATVTLVGTIMASALGWWWADPVAALVIGLGAVWLGVTITREH